MRIRPRHPCPTVPFVSTCPERMNPRVSDEALDWSTREPGRPALVAPHGRLVTYEELGELVRACASTLPSGARIAVTPRSTPTGIAAVLGVWAAGSSVVLMHRHLTKAQSEAVTKRSHALVAVADDLSVTPLRDIGVNVSPDEMLVGLTSGTSGTPKLFARTHQSWQATFARSDQLFSLQPGERVAVPGAIDHSHFLYGTVHALARGATVDLGGTRDARWDEVQVLYSVPTIAADLADAGTPLNAVRVVLSSGARWPKSAKHAFCDLLRGDAQVFDFYGAGELSFVSVNEGEGPDTCVGRPFAGVDVRLANTEGTVENGTGVVEVRSDMLFSGYLDAYGRVQAPQDGWATAGDRGYLDEQGLLHLCGRESRMFTRGALNVEPELVERIVSAHPSVAEVACVPRQDERWGAEPVVFVRLSATLSIGDLRQWCMERLDAVHRPAHLQVVEALPVTHRGKIDYRTLEAKAGDLD